MFSRYDESASKQAMHRLAVQRYPVHKEKLLAYPTSKLDLHFWRAKLAARGRTKGGVLLALASSFRVTLTRD